MGTRRVYTASDELYIIVLNNLGVLSSWKKFKNPRKTRIGQTTTTHPHVHFFLKHQETWKQHKTH